MHRSNSIFSNLDNLEYDGLTWNCNPYSNQSSPVDFTNEIARQSHGGAIPRNHARKTGKVQPKVSKDGNTASENSYQSKVFWNLDFPFLRFTLFHAYERAF